MDFGKWALWAIIPPVVILALHFFVAPALSLGYATYGGPITARIIFLYLLTVACAAVIQKVRHERRSEETKGSTDAENDSKIE